MEAAEALSAFASAHGTRAIHAEASPRQFHTNAGILVRVYLLPHKCCDTTVTPSVACEARLDCGVLACS